MIKNTIPVLLVMLLLTAFGRAEEKASVEVDLVETARTLKSPESQVAKRKQLEEIEKRLTPKEARTQRFAQLLDGFISLDMEGDVKKAEGIRTALAQEENLEEWEVYCLRVLQASIEGKQGKRIEARQSIDWLFEHFPALEQGRKDSKLCAALVEGLERGKGSFKAGLQLSKAGNLAEDGRDEEAKAIYQSIMENFPDTGWAISARNRLNHLKNKKTVAEVMQKKYQPERVRK